MFECAHGDVGGSDAARRRRDRRLRMHWRHGQLSLRMLRASVGHHSWQSRTSVGLQTDDAMPAPAVTYVVPSQLFPPVFSTTTVTTGLVCPQFSSTAMELFAPCVVGSLPPVEEFIVPVYAHVHQEQIAASEMTVDVAEVPVMHQQVIVGMRPERLVDARGPQRCGRTVPSVGAPVLAVQSLRGFDGVDNTAAKFLLQQALQKKEEEEKERKEKELEAHLAKCLKGLR